MSNPYGNTYQGIMGGLIPNYPGQQIVYNYSIDKDPIQVIDDRIKYAKESILKQQEEIVQLEEAKQLLEEHPIEVKIFRLIRKFTG